MMDIIGQDRCERCKFAKGVKGAGGNVIACFRYPPTFVAIPHPKGIGELCKNPTVNPDGWCGEFVARIERGSMQ